jgi:hypothetical protein
MGDFDLSQAAEKLSGNRAMGDALGHYRQHLNGKTAIAFCCSIAHAEAVAKLFNDAGVAAASIDGTMDSATRERLLSELGAGRLKVLTSCALIGEGCGCAISERLHPAAAYAEREPAPADDRPVLEATGRQAGGGARPCWETLNGWATT